MPPDPAANGRIDYLHDELRDLRAYITQRFDALEQRLDAKADATTVSELARRVSALEADHLRWSLPRMVGGAAILAAVSALAGALVGKAVGAG